jgi:hypothetical protein
MRSFFNFIRCDLSKYVKYVIYQGTYVKFPAAQAMIFATWKYIPARAAGRRKFKFKK